MAPNNWTISLSSNFLELRTKQTEVYEPICFVLASILSRERKLDISALESFNPAPERGGRRSQVLNVQIIYLGIPHF